MWCMVIAALRRVESSQSRDGTSVPCTGKQIPIHRATREVLVLHIFNIIHYKNLKRF